MKRIFNVKTLRTLFALSWVAIAVSCTDDPDSPSDSSILINTDSEQLSQRLTLDGTGVVGITAPSNPSGRVLDDDDAEKISLVLISQASSPEYEGNTLQATHVDIDDDYAYVAYNTAGPTYLGAVEILDISDAYKPKIVSQAIFRNADISALEYRDGLLFLAMAIDVDQSEVSDPANLGVVSVSNGQFTSDFRFFSVPGFVATDVTATSQFTALVSGSNGTLTLFDRNLNKLSETPGEDLRSVAFGENRLAILSGTQGAAILNPNSLAEVTRISLEADEAQAKRTLEIEDDHVFIALGRKGAGIYRLSNGREESTLPIPINPENVEQGDIVTNAVSVDDELLFMANGAAGISVADVDDADEPELYGVLDLDGSSNFVRFEDKYIFVATGQGGIQILKIVKDDDDDDDDDEEEGNGEINCVGLPAYRGSSNLNINGNENAAFSGSAQLKNVNIGGEFLFCGSLAIEQNLNVNSNGQMTVVGSFAFGQYRKNTSLNVNSNATLRLSGSTVIYGDLRLNSGATLEFVGNDNTITVYGDVQINSGARIIGNFKDTEDKLD
ncbi:LVIVD repeat-containing protein [Algoriphagus taiwanensis]|uniref:LVIVD repeat-containing protein n=1 Tax=Algoriphagus taiwanensis TaxID=1445656 RepID=A0ABQ6PWY9_9BACT|nr:hypothetical protein Ataiwa_00220 [Algoriphagus taiwanensis]